MKTNLAIIFISLASRSWLYLLVLLTMVFLIAPTLVVMPMALSDARYLTFPPKSISLEPLFSYVHSVEWQSATKVSLITATLTMVLATSMGTAAAYSLHTSSKRLSGLIRGLLMAPMIVPTIFTAIGLFFVYARYDLNNTIPGLVFAHTLIALPYVLINVSAGLRTYDVTQEQAACVLGASRLRAFFEITLPQIRFSVIAAAMFAFAVSLDEAVISLFISGGDSATLTKRMFSSLRSEIDPLIAVVATLMTVLSIIMLVISFTAQRSSKRGKV
ncbi:ABC transporter permease [Pseudomonas sp. RIT-PI-q]|uniref:ABC transporter permease n=1 Tax=Pseudomonas sp. RIT-PI-q TaxID=1690247 RepID=UPI0006CDF1F1|nr:ABC transporter permease [Pseudomonas sp. RIT-PI-q]KPG96033.1 ABC transporter permease [Pseudomonas sp. RIT-PI-q]